MNQIARKLVVETAQVGACFWPNEKTIFDYLARLPRGVSLHTYRTSAKSIEVFYSTKGEDEELLCRLEEHRPEFVERVERVIRDYTLQEDPGAQVHGQLLSPGSSPNEYVRS